VVRSLLYSLLALTLALALASPAHAYTTTKSVTFSSKSAKMTFGFTGLPKATGSSASVKVTLYGEYASSNKYATVSIDGQAQANHTGGSSCPAAGMPKTYSISTGLLSDNALTVVVTNSSNVTAPCPVNRVDVQLSYTTVPDLTITSTSAPSSGSTAKAGDTFYVKCAVRAWHEAISTTFYLYYYHCPSSASWGCTKLGDKQITSSFTSGQEQSFTSGALKLPASAVYGTSYIRFEVDATNAISETVESNNTRYDSISVTALPDLWMSASKVPDSGTTTGPGSKFTGAYTIKNKAAASGVSTNFVVAYHYCASKAATSCPQLGNQVIVQNIDSGATTSFTTPVLTLPGVATSGTRYIRATIDSQKAITEASETNNVVYTAITVGTPVVDAGPSDLNLVDTVPHVDVAWPDATAYLDQGASPDVPTTNVDAGTTGDTAPLADTGAAKEQWFWPDTGKPAHKDTGARPADPGDDSGCAVAGGASDFSALLPLLLLLALRRRPR
jgi:hypothetical protein